MGGCGELMAITLGQHITASELISINTDYSIGYSKTLTGGPSNIGYKSSQYYCHGTTGNIARGWCSYGAFGGAEMYLYKLENGSWVKKAEIGKGSNLVGGSWDKTLNNDWGEGFYRLQGQGSVNVVVHGSIWPAQKNISKGQKLTIYDDFKTSGNRLTGTRITAELLNDGRGGAF